MSDPERTIRDAPSRREYMAVQKRDHGRRLLGVFPAQYPREILWAMNILPVEIWDPPLEVSRSNGHLQSYICSVVKLGLELILQGHCADLDGFLFPHTCDSIQNMASIVHDYLGVEKPCYFFYHPKAPYRDSSRQFYLYELQELIRNLEERFGAMNPADLKKSIDKGREVTSLLGEIYRLRAQGELAVSNHDFYRVIRRNEYLHPDDLIPMLRQFLAEARQPDHSRKRILLSGILPNPPGLQVLLDSLGVRISDDDLLNCGRRLAATPAGEGDPFKALSESYFSMPPCSTRNSSIEERLIYLMSKVDRSRAQGVIFSMVKFCEPELFDLPELVEGLKKKGIPVLLLDMELNQGLSGQMSTRVEAFVELLG
ncbi:MAG: 2-hydroxyacyl-CoA dehydratase [Desulfobacteraceae bacterium]|nr:MAG: 2-hydroxyacyl-CoA dehydratase [Desulfobacteraceae bacterium]